MSRPWKPSLEQIAAVRRRSLDGDDPDDIARDLGVTRRTLASNTETALYFSKRGRPPRTFSDRERAKARHLAASGWSNEKVASALDVSRETLEKHLGRELVEATSDRVAMASAAIGAAAARGDWRAAERILQAAEAGTWRPSASVKVDAVHDFERVRAQDAELESVIAQMTNEERAALRVVAAAGKRIAALEDTRPAKSSIIGNGELAPRANSRTGIFN